MNSENFSCIKTKRNRCVYQSVLGPWGNDKFPGMTSIEPTGKSYSSYKFVGDKKDACKIIKRIYGINNKDYKIFSIKYKQAISGSGHEERDILTLHSSSRLALQMFYNVENKPLTLSLDGKDVVFNYSTFEFQNPVIDPQYPSNIDVVLVNKDENIVLFLESKFAECYCDASKSSDGISTQYLKKGSYSECFYDKKWLNDDLGINTSYDPNKLQKEFMLSIESDSHRDEKKVAPYLDGFKQMISHYVGIRNRIDGKPLDKYDEKNSGIANTVLKVVENSSGKIYLGEIVFDKWIEGSEPQKAMKEYGELYEKLADKMNKIIEEDAKKNSSLSRFKVLPTQLKYSEIVNYKDNKSCIDPKTLDFYGLN